MKLSDESINNIAYEISDDVMSIIKEDSRYRDAIMNSLPSAIREVLGEADPNIIARVGTVLMDNVTIDCSDIKRSQDEHDYMDAFVKAWSDITCKITKDLS